MKHYFYGSLSISRHNHKKNQAINRAFRNSKLDLAGLTYSKQDKECGRYTLTLDIPAI